MNPDVLILLKLSAAFLTLFAVAEFLYHRTGVPAEHTRKIVHAGTGFLTLLFPLTLQHPWQVAVLCGSFLALLLITMRTGWLPSVNAVPRKTWGSALYPLIVLSVFWFYSFMRARAAGCNPLLYFYLPVLILAVCDPLAALVGQRASRRSGANAEGKTWAGSFAFFQSALLISALVLFLCCGVFVHVGRTIGTAGALAMCTTLAERWSSRGWDNFTIPAVAAACLYLFHSPLFAG